jgi:hypothetical protein
MRWFTEAKSKSMSHVFGPVFTLAILGEISMNTRRFILTIAGVAAMLCSALVFAAPAHAAYTISTFQNSWYLVGISGAVAPAIADGTNLLIAYSYYSDGSGKNEINAYLAGAYKLGAKVAYEVPKSFWDLLNITAIKSWCSAIDTNSGLYGYYLYDEPPLRPDATIAANMRAAYTAIKTVSSKPVLVAFGSNGSQAPSYSNSFDILLQDEYRCITGQSEFAGMPKYMEAMNIASENAVTFNTPWMAVTQAFAGAWSTSYRLPTYNEHRFNVYYPLLKGAKGISNWGRSWCTSQPGGDAWITNTFRPVAAELNRNGAAYINGFSNAISVSTTGTNIQAKAFEHPDGRIVAVTVKTATGTTTNTVTINLGSKMNASSAYTVKQNDSAVACTKSGTSLVISNVQYPSYKVNLFEIEGAPSTSLRIPAFSSASQRSLRVTAQGIIAYQLPEATRVRISVCDVSGRTIQVPLDQQQEAGAYRMKLGDNRTMFSSGMYLCRMSTNDGFSDTRTWIVR